MPRKVNDREEVKEILEAWSCGTTYLDEFIDYINTNKIDMEDYYSGHVAGDYRAFAAGVELGISKPKEHLTQEQIALIRGLNLAVATEKGKSHIVDLALRHHLVSRLTSLVAVDKTVVRPQGATLKTHHLASNLPAGWKFDKVSKPRPKFTFLVKNHLPSPDQSMVVVNPATLVALSLSHGATWTAFHVWLGCGLLLSGLFLLYLSYINRRDLRTCSGTQGG